MKKIVFTSVFIFFFLFLTVFAQHKTENNRAYSLPATKKSSDPLEASKERGQIVYQKECLSCHQEDGSGAQRMFPPLIKTKAVLGEKAYLIQTVLKGSGGINKDREEIYQNVMAPHNHLSNRQVADVLTYIRNSFGNKVVAVNAAEVKVIRARIK